jgi:HD-GYP domain-containing protein (c-di-GMP phosphodiesterase class II)
MGPESARPWQRSGAPSPPVALRPAAAWLDGAVDLLARELREHHAPTAEHSHRAARVARAVAEEMALGALDTTEAELVAVLHDVGKLAIDPELLDFPGRLSDQELERMRRHTIEGEELLARTAGLEQLAAAVRATHEAWDGSGYPDGLSGDEIPLTARIVAVVDAYDAMVSARAYRTALSDTEATRRLEAGAGVQFDPDVVDALLRVLRREGRA